MIFVNYKTYEQGSGDNAINLTKILELAAHEHEVKIIPVVQLIDAEKIVASTTLEVWVQHIDPVDYGAHTGYVLPEEVAKSGISGVFLNHSEHKFNNFDDLYKANEMAMSANLKTLIFATDTDELRKICSLAPTYVAYEPAELVGSTTVSVAQGKADVIAQASEISRSFSLPLVVGAGIHSQDDVRKSIELGAVGVAVATDIVKAIDPQKELVDLIGGFE